MWDFYKLESTFCSFFQNMSHQSDDLAVPMVRWLGVHPTDISWLGIKAQPLTAVDISKLRNLATRPYVSSHKALQDQVQFIFKFIIYA